VAQGEYLRVLRCRRPSEQSKPGQHLAKEPIDHTNRHDRRSLDVTIAQVKPDCRIFDQARFRPFVLCGHSVPERGGGVVSSLAGGARTTGVDGRSRPLQHRCLRHRAHPSRGQRSDLQRAEQQGYQRSDHPLLGSHQSARIAALHHTATHTNLSPPWHHWRVRIVAVCRVFSIDTQDRLQVCIGGCRSRPVSLARTVLVSGWSRSVRMSRACCQVVPAAARLPA
jgi:hypothetical protein